MICSEWTISSDTLPASSFHFTWPYVPNTYDLVPFLNAYPYTEDARCVAVRELYAIAIKMASDDPTKDHIRSIGRILGIEVAS